ncbi:FRIGIDA-like protein [Drosera capensis]
MTPPLHETLISDPLQTLTQISPISPNLGQKLGFLKSRSMSLMPRRRRRRRTKTTLTMTPPLRETLISDPPQTLTQISPISPNLGQKLGFLKQRSMSMMPRRIEADLDEAESFVGEFGAAFESLRSHASAIVSFSHQWESTQRSFIAMKSLFASRVEEMRKVESELCVREKGLELKRKELEGVEKSIEAKRSELECKEELIEERFREIELKKYELECKEKSTGERMKEFELKEKRFNGNVGGVVVKTEPVTEFGVDDGGDDNDASLRLCVKMDGKALQLFLNDRFNEHESMGDQVYYALRLSKNPARLVLDAMEGFFAPHLKKGDSEYQARVVRSSCLLLLDQLLKLKPLVERLVKEKVRGLAVLWREKMKGEGESYMVVLGFLMLVAVYDLSGEIEKNELGRLLCLIDKRLQAHLRAQLYPRLGFSAPRVTTPASQIALVGNGLPELRTPQIVNSVTRRTTGPKNVLDTLCQEMDANGLSSYLIFHGNMQNLSQKKVVDALRFASDPARLVFSVLQGFSETSSDDNVQRESNTTVSTLLLEQLMELSPDVTFDLRAEASKFASHWKARLEKEEAKARKSASNGKASPSKDGTLPSDVLCFLMFLTVYKLGSYFDGNEVVALFGTCYNDDEVYRLEQNVHLRFSLSLEDKIPGIVEALTKKKKLLVAVRYICAFDLVSRFPPFPLLKQYVEMQIKRCKTRNTVSGQNKLARREVTALRHVIKCISDHKQLESQCSLSVFQQRIEQLEEEIAERNRKAAEILSLSSSSKTKESAQVICSSSTEGPEAQIRRKRTASATTNCPRSRETTQEKRPKPVDTCTSICQPAEKSQENSPRTATENINSEPPSQPPCSTRPEAQIRRKRTASATTNSPHSRETTQEKRPKLVDTCTSICQPAEKSQENSPRTATANINSEPPSQPPCSTRPEAQIPRKRTASATTNGPCSRKTTQEKRPKLVDTCTSICQPAEKSQGNSPRTATANINSEPPSQPPCSTRPVMNHHASLMSNAGNSCSTVQQTNAPVNSHYQISYPSPSVTTHVSGWPDGAPAVSGQHSYVNQTQLVPGAYYPFIGLDPRQFITGGAYPGIGPSHIPHGHVFNQLAQTQGYQGQFYDPFGANPYAAQQILQQIFYHTQ